jgi:hypothetical protein
MWNPTHSLFSKNTDTSAEDHNYQKRSQVESVDQDVLMRVRQEVINPVFGVSEVVHKCLRGVRTKGHPLAHFVSIKGVNRKTLDVSSVKSMVVLDKLLPLEVFNDENIWEALPRVFLPKLHDKGPAIPLVNVNNREFSIFLVVLL